MPSKFRESLVKLVNEESEEERMSMVESIADDYDDEDIDNLKTIKEERDSLKESLTKSEAKYDELNKRYQERFIKGSSTTEKDEDEEPKETIHKTLKELGF